MAWPENEQPLAVFQHLGRAWRYNPMGGLIGLDWPQVESRLHTMGVPVAKWPDLCDALELLEAEFMAEA